MLDLFHHPLKLRADPSRVVVRPFHLPWKEPTDGEPDRTEKLAREVMRLDMRTVRSELALVRRDFEQRHWQTERVFAQRYQEIEQQVGFDGSSLRPEMRQLIGAYFCHEYSYAAAALMNPSVVRHPDQSGLQPGAVRFLMSLRAVGEGHISSIAFREGIITADRELELMPEPPFATAANSVEVGANRLDGAVTVHRHEDSTLSGTVIFPITEAQRNGLEDLRLVEFTHDDGRTEWLGTYTAYSGHSIRSELMRTTDFRSFTLEPIEGDAARNKGLALFPRALDGGYKMIGRQDGQNLYLIESDRLDRWEGGRMILEPRFPWELIQIGNCGPPIELDEGWLLLTHGVGAMRKYSIGAALLDKKDPSKVLGRSRQPLISAADEDREGYVPNVVYTCGGLKVGGDIFIPYGVADSSVAFASISIESLVANM
ncbi:putative GH43/DUF377 family glycosyl hydrolase [Sphingomonas jejuensis]|uniref:GH43/DUF377 family glycosyl hydrolase n=1 Tax=Sphingomonas jejuensis TaxID=904715 RepID=A0ABX0XJQ6_9SPHN|nr:glycoside hydrolase family 130 protein [Sphingomonas jejuensis]NJC32975.1 putative GH43/DUF377 family glycosyl hydrolase [Sphingomonas jejuensis]